MRPHRSLIAFLAAVLAVFAVAEPRALGQEHIRNGGFEAGLTDWLPINAFATGCPAAEGTGALRLGTAASLPIFARQSIQGPLAAGAYRVSGRIARISGTAPARLNVDWLDATETVIDQDQFSLAPSSSAYEAFEFLLTAPPSAYSALIDLTITTNPTTSAFCFDSISFDGLPLASPTPEPTATPASSSSATPGTTATATLVASPSSSPVASPTPTRVPQPGVLLQNGSFEEGAAGWQKFGGELDVTSSPRVSGLYAGVLTSNTTSTKWAYQTVAVDAQHHYQFSGHLQSGSGVAAGLLRISWYATPNGSGEAISTTDSTTGVAAGSGGYVWLTTGAVQPPPGARTARPRVILTPAGATPATLYMDDLDFVQVQPATPTPLPSNTAVAAIATVAPAALSAVALATNTPAATSTALISPTADATRVSEVSSVRIAATIPPLSQVAGARTGGFQDGDGGVPLFWLIGFGAFVIGLGGAYWQGRRKA